MNKKINRQKNFLRCMEACLCKTMRMMIILLTAITLVTAIAVMTVAIAIIWKKAKKMTVNKVKIEIMIINN
jgi:hypothetical protein